MDLGGVLMRHNPRYSAHMADLLTAPLPDELSARFELGQLPTAEFLSELQQYAAPGVTTSQLAEAWNSLHDGIPGEYFALLQQWKNRGFRLWLLSNNNPLRWQHVLDNYDMGIFERIFLSHELHLMKPDPQVFRLVSDEADGRNILFVDDSLANRQAAEAFGWTCFATISELQQFIK